MANQSNATLSLPNAWGLTTLMLHYEGDAGEENDPFTGTVMVQLRMDVRPGASPTDIRTQDMNAVRGMVAPEFIEADEVDVSGTQVSFLEWVYATPDARRLRQLVLYLPKDARLYTLTATHKADSFERIRNDVLSLATTLLSEDGPLGVRGAHLKR
jgi:hypothetical protein